MRYSRVFLVFPAFESNTGSSRPSPSLGYLEQSLSDAGIECDILDMKLGHSFKDLVKRIDRFKPDLVGFAVFTLHHRTVFKMIEKLKLRCSEIDVIVGGPHISIAKEETLKICSDIDFACVHEGEDLIVELCKGENLEGIKGLVYRKDGQVCFNGIREYENNLSRFNFPRLKKFELGRYANEILIISSRGCPYKCIYCSVHLVLGKKLRVRNVQHVVDELEYWYNKGKRIFNFVDDNFTFYEKRVYEFCDELERRNLKNIVLRASNGVRADRLNYKLLKRMKEVGFRSIGIGVESGNDRILKILRKGESVEQIEKAIRNTCELGYEVALFFVFGAPGETLQDIEDSIDLALKYPVFKVDFYNLLPFPGTELYDWVNNNNMWLGDPAELLDSSDKSTRFGSKLFFETEELSADVQMQVKKRVQGVMRIVTKRYLKNILRQKFGVFSSLLTYWILTKSVQKLYFNNNRFRRFVEKVRYSLFR